MEESMKKEEIKGIREKVKGKRVFVRKHIGLSTRTDNEQLSFFSFFTVLFSFVIFPPFYG
jgi:hypothetical protein